MAKFKSVNKKVKWAVVAVIVVWLLSLLAVYLRDANFAVLNPAGQVAMKERNLLILTVVLGLVVIVPVYVMTALIAWRYREGNHKAKYSPNMSGNWLAETVWWGIPTLIILALSIITWNSSHDLDPHKALVSSKAPLNVQVVALDWKWLFIYPEQGVASVNELVMPVGTPVKFEVTADAPMNAFWIPRLGSQIYAMPGMATHLNLIADKPGVFEGSSANVSGKGFAGMRFTARARPSSVFDNWLQNAGNTPQRLDFNTYRQLAKPSTDNPVVYYSNVDQDLFDRILNKYLTPDKQGADDAR